MTEHTKATVCQLTPSSTDLVPSTRVSLDSFCTFYTGNELQIPSCKVKYDERKTLYGHPMWAGAHVQ